MPRSIHCIMLWIRLCVVHNVYVSILVFRVLSTSTQNVCIIALCITLLNSQCTHMTVHHLTYKNVVGDKCHPPQNMTGNMFDEFAFSLFLQTLCLANIFSLHTRETVDKLCSYSSLYYDILFIQREISSLLICGRLNLQVNVVGYEISCSSYMTLSATFALTM